jgi:hypothetical protein
MSKSERIRSLAREGLTVGEIARRVGVRYQHVYKVLGDAGLLPTRRGPTPQDDHVVVRQAPAVARKPELTVEMLRAAGFKLSGKWIGSPDAVSIDEKLPKEVGVYAFAKEGIVLYVGVATMGLSKRLYFYGKPGATQLTSLRLNALIKKEVATGAVIEIYTASPPDLEWNGLPVHGSAGLELGLIKRFALPWNMRSAK